MKRLRLAQRRKAIGLSQERLAEMLGVDRTTVVRWEAGRSEPMPWHRPRLAEALLLSVEQTAELLEETRTPRQVPDVLEISSAELRSLGSGPIHQADSNSPDEGLLTGILLIAKSAGFLETGQPVQTRRLGLSDVDRLNAIIALYYSVDREHGGGAIYEDVARFAESASFLTLQTFSDTLAPNLFKAVAMARMLAAWTAFDACQHFDAQRHFQAAERHGLQSGDLLLTARIRYGHARQLQHLRQNVDALDVVRLARCQLGSQITPTVAAMLTSTEATSLGALGEVREAKAALDKARREFDDIGTCVEPEWARFYDLGELFAQRGRVYRDFARGDKRYGKEAFDWTQQALGAYGPQNVRSAVLGEVSLCSASFLADEPEAGLAAAARMITSAKQLNSPRIFDRIRNVQRDLVQYASVSGVPDLANALRVVGTVER